MASFRKIAFALALLAPIGFLVAAPTNATEDNLIDSSRAGELSNAAFAATVVSDGHLTIRATRVGADTTAGQIVRLVESAPIGDTRMQNHAERLADRPM